MVAWQETEPAERWKAGGGGVRQMIWCFPRLFRVPVRKYIIKHNTCSKCEIVDRLKWHGGKVKCVIEETTSENKVTRRSNCEISVNNSSQTKQYNVINPHGVSVHDFLYDSWEFESETHRESSKTGNDEIPRRFHFSQLRHILQRER